MFLGRLVKIREKDLYKTAVLPEGGAWCRTWIPATVFCRVNQQSPVLTHDIQGAKKGNPADHFL
jgi:hypothetical protein